MLRTKKNAENDLNSDSANSDSQTSANSNNETTANSDSQTSNSNNETSSKQPTTNKTQKKPRIPFGLIRAQNARRMAEQAKAEAEQVKTEAEQVKTEAEQVKTETISKRKQLFRNTRKKRLNDVFRAKAMQNSGLKDISTNLFNNTSTIPDEERKQANEEEKEEAYEEEKEEGYEEEEEEVEIGDPKLPHILKIGQQGYAEYIELGKMPLDTEGIFNAFQTGNRARELQKFYNVKTNQECAAMQRAFGVKDIHSNPPILGFLTEKCLPKDFALVRRALQYRVQTLKSSISIKGSALSAKPDQKRLEWIQTILKDSQGITKQCPDQKQNAPTPQLLSKLKWKKECPCLEELSLLRDLVYLIALLQGNTDPLVKKQLESITLSKLLNSAKKNNRSQPNHILMQVINTLEQSLQRRSNAPIAQDSLKQIYEFLLKTAKDVDTVNIPETVNVPMILDTIKEIITSLKKNIDASRLTEEKERELRAKEGELEALKAKLANSGDDSMRQALIREIERLELQIEQIKSKEAATEEELKKCKDLEQQKNNLEKQIMDLRGSSELLFAKQKRKEDNLTNIIKTLENTVREKQVQINALAGNSAENLKKELDESRAKVGALESQIATLKADLEKANEARSELAALQTRLSSKNSDLANLVAELETKARRANSAESELAEIKEQLRSAQEKHESTIQENKQTIESLQENITKARANLALVEAEKETSEGLSDKLETTQSEIRRLEAELAAKTTSGTQQEQEYAKAKNALEEQIAALESKLSGVVKERDEEKQRADTQEQLGIQKNLEIQSLKSQVDSKEAELASAGNQTEKLQQLENELATLRPQLESLKNKVAENKTEKQRLEIALEAAHAAKSDVQEDSEALLAEIEKLKSMLAEQNLTIEEYQTEREITQKRLENLLGLLIVNPNIREEAEKFMRGDSNIENTLKENLCDFFKYLSGLLNLQMRRIGSSGLPSEAKEDIFAIFRRIPEYNNRALLNDITNLFQEMFVEIAKTTTIPRELQLTREYPELYKVLNGYDLTDGTPLADKFKPAGPGKEENRKFISLMNELGAFGYLNNIVIEPLENGSLILKKTQTFQLPREFSHSNTNHTTPLVIFGIKMIQLLAETLDSRYKSLADQCGFSSKPSRSNTPQSSPMMMSQTTASEETDLPGLVYSQEEEPRSGTSTPINNADIYNMI